LTLVPFKRKLVILVIHKRFFVAAPLKRRLVFFLTPVPIKMRLVKPLSSGAFFFKKKNTLIRINVFIFYYNTNPYHHDLSPKCPKSHTQLMFGPKY
jgi:hypothetical protein